MKLPALPMRLYKYRAFNVNTLRLLSEAEVYYARPEAFNDPLDCNPTIEIDVDRETLERLCFSMLLRFMDREKAKKEIGNHRYMTSEHGDYKSDAEADYLFRLAEHIRTMLQNEFGKRGVLSLAARWDCPLMWSHYANEHRGVCIEYDMTDHMCPDIQYVDYRRPRSIRTSTLVEWKINGSTTAEKSLQDTFFFAKAPQWKYEREWRHVTLGSGAGVAPFRVGGICFGLRCDESVVTTMIKLHAKEDRSIRFYGMYPLSNSFRLKRRLMDTDEIQATGLRSSALLDFRDVFVTETEAQPITRL